MLCFKTLRSIVYNFICSDNSKFIDCFILNVIDNEIYGGGNSVFVNQEVTGEVIQLKV